MKQMEEMNHSCVLPDEEHYETTIFHDSELQTAEPENNLEK